jgi:hypothetical protein
LLAPPRRLPRVVVLHVHVEDVAFGVDFTTFYAIFLREPLSMF